VGDRVSDRPALRGRGGLEIGVAHEGAKVVVLGAQVGEQRREVGGDGGLPRTVVGRDGRERTLTAADSLAG
jgi:hypothetical protein